MAIREPTSPPQIRPNRLRMSYEEYLQWADEDTHAEWVEGANPQLRFYEMAGMPAETIEQIRRQLQAGLKPDDSGAG